MQAVRKRDCRQFVCTQLTLLLSKLVNVFNLLDSYERDIGYNRFHYRNIGRLGSCQISYKQKSNKTIAEANAFEVQRNALLEDYKRVQGEVDVLKKRSMNCMKNYIALKMNVLTLSVKIMNCACNLKKQKSTFVCSRMINVYKD